MKAVVLLDDLDMDEGSRVIASTSVRLGWDGVWYELDLTSEHHADLWEGIKPYLKAGRRVQAARAPEVKPARERAAIEAAEASPSVPRYGRVVLHHAVDTTPHRYWKNLREWAAANGYAIKQHKDNTYSYPVDMVEEYERHLSLLDRKAEARAS